MSKKKLVIYYQSRSSVPKSRFSRNHLSTSGRSVTAVFVPFQQSSGWGCFHTRSVSKLPLVIISSLLSGISFNLYKIWDFSQHCLNTSVFNITLFFQEDSFTHDFPGLHHVRAAHFQSLLERSFPYIYHHVFYCLRTRFAMFFWRKMNEC